LATPLTELTKKGAFSWSKEAHAAYEKLKYVMSSNPLLAIPDFSLPFIIDYDASGIGVGCILMHKGCPIAFESRKLTPIERTFSVYEKEMLAIMYALTKFKQYLVCGKFIVRSDHNSLKYFIG